MTPEERARIVEAKTPVVVDRVVVEHASGAQRLGMFLALIEAACFGLLAAMHFGADLSRDGVELKLPLLYPAGIVEGVLALALLIAVLVPGGGPARAGRVLAAQILALICVFVGQIALMRAVALTTTRSMILYAVVLVLALASIALIASPALRRRAVTH